MWKIHLVLLLAEPSLAPSLVVELPRGHGVKVATNPNMALLAVKDAACTKRKHNPQAFTLHHKGRKVDLSLTVRFTKIPNIVEVPEKERAAGEQEVTIVLQLPSGERLVAGFPPYATLARGGGPVGGAGGEPWPGGGAGGGLHQACPRRHHAPRAGPAAGQGPVQAKVQTARRWS